MNITRANSIQIREVRELREVKKDYKICVQPQVLIKKLSDLETKQLQYTKDISEKNLEIEKLIEVNNSMQNSITKIKKLHSEQENDKIVN